MERIVHIAGTRDGALRWDNLRQVRMTPEERQAAARILKARAFDPDAKDIREWHRSGGTEACGHAFHVKCFLSQTHAKAHPIANPPRREGSA